MEVSQKAENRTSYDLEIPLLGIYLKKMKTLFQNDTCTPVFVPELYQDTEATKVSLSK